MQPLIRMETCVRYRLIGTGQYYDCQKLVSLTVGGHISVINTRAFANCIELQTVIGNSVTTINDDAFAVSDFGTTIGNVNSMSSTAFGTQEGNHAIGAPVTSLVIDSNHLISVDYGEEATFMTTYFPFGGYLQNLTIGASVVKIGSNAFKGCIGLQRVTIEGSVTEISAGAFSSCDSLNK